MSTFSDILSAAPVVRLKQVREMVEFFGYETSNKYSIQVDGREVAFAAERGGGVFGFMLRQFLGHWRRFDIDVVDASRDPVMRAHHPFRFYFQRLEIRRPSGELVGALEQRFSLLHKKFDMHDRLGNTLMTVKSPMWKLWTFPFMKNGKQGAVVRKKWGGLLKEALMDADSFELEFSDPSLSLDERMLLLGAAVFIDLQYFERKAN